MLCLATRHTNRLLTHYSYSHFIPLISSNNIFKVSVNRFKSNTIGTSNRYQSKLKLQNFLTSRCRLTHHSYSEMNNVIASSTVFFGKDVFLVPIIQSVRYAGHAHWQNVAQDKKAVNRIRTKYRLEFVTGAELAIKDGGPNPLSNVKLKNIIEKARKNHVTDAIIKRTIERVASRGKVGEVSYFDIKGPFGTWLIVEANCQKVGRTTADIRGIVKKFGAKVVPSARHTFDDKGVIHLTLDGQNLDENMLTFDEYEELAINCDAEDVTAIVDHDEQDVIQFVTDFKDLHKVTKAIEEKLPKNHRIKYSGRGFIPTSVIDSLSEKELEVFSNFYDKLAEHIEVVRIFTNVVDSTVSPEEEEEENLTGDTAEST